MATIERKSKNDWLIHFRKAKSFETLELMFDRQFEKLCKENAPKNMLADLVLANEARENEIETNRFCR